MPEPNELFARIDTLSQLVAAAFEADDAVRDQAARNAADALRDVLADLARTRETAAPVVDRDTIRHVIAPELERYWARQRKDPRP